MIVSPEEIQQLEVFFASFQIPLTIKLSGAITYNNLPQSISSTIQHLKDGIMPAIALAPRYWALLEIKKALAVSLSKPA